MEITDSTFDDTTEIFRRYRIANAYQKTKGCDCWPEFEHQLIQDEIAELCRKLILENSIACVWATMYLYYKTYPTRKNDSFRKRRGFVLRRPFCG